MPEQADDILAFEFYKEASRGENLQEHLRDSVPEPDKVDMISKFLEVAGDIMPGRTRAAELVFPTERKRVKKRNVLPQYDDSFDTYQAEVIETTVTRFMTHEPCVEHVPVKFEDEIDPEEYLQSVFRPEGNPEGRDYEELREADGDVRFAE